MSIAAGKAIKRSLALAVMAVSAITLSGCGSIGMFADKMPTGSTAASGSGDLGQPMPTVLGNNPQVASGPYLPPNDIGGGTDAAALAPANGGVQSNDLPVLTSSPGTNAMSAQPSLAPVTVGPKPAALGTTQPSTPLAAANDGSAYSHTIESGESLYSIARRYGVTAQAIVQANGLSSPDKIYVGQRIVIPGSAAPLAAKGPVLPLDSDTPGPAPLAAPAKAQVTTAAIADPQLLESPTQPPAAQPQQVASVEPQPSGADKFRWPVSGKVIVDFAQSKGTGINIEAPEGSTVRAAENGTVIYVGSGVEGYGNLILIRHPNGYVSAYAHLKAMNVVKGQNVSRGDIIGQTGMTGSVNRPQLHFELRKGATPVDPMPLLAT